MWAISSSVRTRIRRFCTTCRPDCHPINMTGTETRRSMGSSEVASQICSTGRLARVRGTFGKSRPAGQEAAAKTQLKGYTDAAGSMVVAGDNNIVFRGAPSITLDSEWFRGRPMYTYAPGTA
jgi:hypothetical protein